MADAASGVMHRVFPRVADDFIFKNSNELLVKGYVAYGQEGKVVVEARSAVAMCRGAYDYLRKAVGAEASWSGTSLGSFKGRLPEMRLATNCYMDNVLQDNVCTFGYTTAFYGWKEWEHYLDIMALHGVNMEFSPIGGEAIWQRVWKQFGITQEQLDNFFTGPAFLPWHRMGNVNKHDGPLPESYLRKSVVLEKKILARMRELGMDPVAPAFAGFVPPGFAEKYPNEPVIHVGSWAGFEGPYRTWILNPLSSMYSKIGGAYIKEWTREFGQAHYYLADSFNELEVPVPPERDKRLATLAAFGKAVYDGIQAGDPNGTWVMQGWLFVNGRDFWDNDSVQALLSKVPDDRMLILDLYAESYPVWKHQKAFYGKPWILSTITTWGGNNQAYGNFGLYAPLVSNALEATPSERGKLSGYGMSFEGSESNETQYELMCDSAWAGDQPIDIPAFIKDTILRSRYGGSSPDADLAWTDFAASVYNMPTGQHPNHLLQSRPYDVSPEVKERVNDSETFKRGVMNLAAARGDLGRNKLYQNDLIQMVSQWELVEADACLKDAVLAANEGMTNQSKGSEADFVKLATEADRLLASHPLDRLQRWVDMARAWGDSPSDKDYYEADAKRQITVWGGPDLSEYAAKMWSGLISTYYVPRWTQWLDAKRSGKTWDMHAWEEKWITTPGRYAVQPFSDPVAQAASIVEELKALPKSTLAASLAGNQVGGWKSGEQNETLAQRVWDLTPVVKKNGELTLRFQYTSGGCRLEINGVELLRDGVVVSSDPHSGRTGNEDILNAYKLKVEGFEPGHKWELRAKIRSDGGSDSNGSIYAFLR
jgi:alpha-N-acetylglucosaminidase